MLLLSERFILLCWLIFAVVWLIASFRTKATVQRSGWAWRFIGVSIAALAFLVFRFAPSLAGSMAAILWTPTLPIVLLGDLLVALGLGITLWARFILGGNWSGDVVIKENHELIERGPYHYVRHPIYSGILVMVLGSAIAFGRVGGFVVLAFLLIGFWFKSQQEEKILTQHFGNAYPEYKSRVHALIPFIL